MRAFTMEKSTQIEGLVMLKMHINTTVPLDISTQKTYICCKYDVMSP